MKDNSLLYLAIGQRVPFLGIFTLTHRPVEHHLRPLPLEDVEGDFK